jgi:hypothetical protein
MWRLRLRRVPRSDQERERWARLERRQNAIAVRVVQVCDELQELLALTRAVEVTLSDIDDRIAELQEARADDC